MSAPTLTRQGSSVFGNKALQTSLSIYFDKSSVPSGTYNARANDVIYDPPYALSTSDYIHFWMRFNTLPGMAGDYLVEVLHRYATESGSSKSSGINAFITNMQTTFGTSGSGAGAGASNSAHERNSLGNTSVSTPRSVQHSFQNSSSPSLALLNTIAFITLALDFDPDDARVKAALSRATDIAETVQARDVLRMLSQRIDPNISDRFTPLLITVTTLHSAAELTRLADLTTLSLDDEDVVFAGAAFFYPALLTIARYNTTATNNAIRTIIGKLHSLAAQLRVNPAAAHSSFLAFLHVLKQLLLVSSQLRVAIDQDLITALKPFLLWPCPLSTKAKELLLLLWMESILPGSVYSRCLLEEYNVVSVGSPEEPRCALFYLLDAHDDFGKSTARCLELVEFPLISKESHMPIEFQASVLVSLLDATSKIESDEFETIKTLSDEQINSLYRDCLSLIRHSDSTQAVQSLANGKLVTKSEELRRSIHACRQSDAGTSSPRNDDALLGLIDLPIVAHISIETTLKFSWPSRDQIRLATSVDPPQTPCHARLVELLRQIDPVKDCELQTLRLVIFGGDDLLQNFICAYLLILQRQPELLAKTNLKLLIIPASPNGVASWLARHDSWYNRHIFQVFRSFPLLVPTYKIDTSPFDADVAIPPHYYLRHLVESYAREANETSKFHVYTCSGWISASVINQPTMVCDKLIPFMQHFEFGLLPGARSRSSSDETPPIDVIISFTTINFDGTTGETYTEDPAPYSNVIAASVPRKNHAGLLCLPNPLRPGLEMSAIMHRSFQKSATKQNILAMHSRQHIRSLDIRSATPNGTFNVACDDQFFGPFSRVLIEPAFDSSGNHLSIGIQHFQPFVFVSG